MAPDTFTKYRSEFEYLVYILTGTGTAAGVPAVPSTLRPGVRAGTVGLGGGTVADRACREVPSVGSPSKTTPKPAFTGFNPDRGAVRMAATI